MALPFNITPQALIQDAILGLNLITNTIRVDIVGVYNQDSMTQVFGNARPAKASVRETSKLLNHPAETGVILSDHKVILQNEINIPMVIDSRYWSSTYQQIRNAWLNSTKLAVQTRTGVYRNMVIQNMPHEEDADMFDVITLGLNLKEVQFFAPLTIASGNQPSNYVPLNPVNNNTVLRGLQSTAIPLTTSIMGYIHAASVWGL